MSALERIFKAVVGLFLIFVAVSLFWYWKSAFLLLVKGAVPLVIGLAGLVFLFLSLEK